VFDPETRYAGERSARVAYQLFGDGPIDLIVGTGPASNIDLIWEQPAAARFYESLGSFARVAIFDRRGTGLSDAIAEAPILEQQAADLRAVADAAGMERPALLMVSGATSMGAMFAATQPDRASALVLFGAAPAGGGILDPATHEAVLDEIENSWGQGRMLAVYSPRNVDNERFRRWFGRYERNAVSPGAARQLVDLGLTIDLTDVLPSIQAPTLVLHRTDDRTVPIANGRRVAELIPGARFMEFAGDDHFIYLDNSDAILDEVEVFLTGVRRGGRDPDRVLATVLFTDIVGSTELASRSGDREWRMTLQEHDRLVAAQLERFRGRAVKMTGDGVLATFDGPARAIRCAQAVGEVVRSRLGVELRAGLHTGEVEVMGDDVGGIAVHIGARVSALAGPSEVLVSGTVKDLVVGSDIEFEDRGTQALKGVPGEWRLHAVR
jgi:class 3 adenylate cyclase